MKNKDNRFIEILEWVYEKQDDGFFEEDLIEKFISTPKEKNWYLKLFKDDQIIQYVDYIDNKHRYIITAKGVSTVIGYHILKEAEAGGKKATYIAIIAILIGVIVGITQIIIDLFQLRFKC